MKNSVEVKFKKFHPNATIPMRATELAGGWDVTVTEIDMSNFPLVICNLGFGLQPPPNYKVTLVPRSSLTKTNWILQNSPGLGDADYIHEYSFRFRGLPIGLQTTWGSFEFLAQLGEVSDLEFKYEEFPYKIGDRIGQIYLEEVIPIDFIEVDELESISSRTGGYGSTNN